MSKLVNGIEKYAVQILGLAIGLVVLMWVLGQAGSRNIPVVSSVAQWTSQHIASGGTSSVAPASASLPVPNTYH